MATLDELVLFLDEELKTAEITDYPGAFNGLQLANGGAVKRIVAAVDASLPVVLEAADGEPGLLLVHHGMFWQGVQPVKGALYRKMKAAMDAGLAIYSSHLPLDIHPLVGNNIQLAGQIGMSNPSAFLDQKGLLVGIRGRWNGTRDELCGALAKVVGANVHLCPGGAEEVSEVGIITGGAGSLVENVYAAGVDTFVTGEGPHWSYPLAEEIGLNVIYAGHYATETFGVKALAATLAKEFGIPWRFLDHPSGL